MKKESSGRLEFSDFIVFKVVVPNPEYNENLKTGIKWVKCDVGISPTHISSYVGISYKDDDEKEIPCTRVYVGGASYWIDLPFNEFHAIVCDLNRGFTFEGAETEQ